MAFQVSVSLNYGIYLLRHFICLVNWDQVYHVVPICVWKIKIFVHTFDFPQESQLSVVIYSQQLERTCNRTNLWNNLHMKWLSLVSIKLHPERALKLILRWYPAWYISIVKIINDTAFSLKCHCAVIFYVPTLFQRLWKKHFCYQHPSIGRFNNLINLPNSCCTLCRMSSVHTESRNIYMC